MQTSRTHRHVQDVHGYDHVLPLRDHARAHVQPRRDHDYENVGPLLEQ